MEVTGGVPPEYSFCKRFRKWAKRANVLPRGKKEPDKDGERSLLIEEIWEFGATLYVWGTADALNRVLRFLYDGEDDAAVKLLSVLADEELKALREKDREEELDNGE